MKKILDNIFIYKIVKKSEYADMEKQITLSIKERENIKKAKNRTIKELQNKIESLETIIQTKYNLFKKKDHMIYQLITSTRSKESEIKHKEKEIRNLKKEIKLLEKEIENQKLELENTSEELKQKKTIISRMSE